MASFYRDIDRPARMPGLARHVAIAACGLALVAHQPAGAQLTSSGQLSIALNAPDAGFGTAIASGDFNGDGREDVAVGAPGRTLFGFTEAGRVSVYLSEPQSGLGLSQALDQAILLGAPEVAADERFGEALAAGDFDGDGFDDLAIGAPLEDVGAGIVDAGIVHFVTGVIVFADGFETGATDRWNATVP